MFETVSSKTLAGMSRRLSLLFFDGPVTSYQPFFLATPTKKILLSMQSRIVFY